MAKKQLTPLSKAIISGAVAFVLLGGALATLQGVQENQNNQGQAYEFRGTPVRRTPQPLAGVQCYDRVLSMSGKYYWPDACRGKATTMMCAQVLTALTSDEQETYNKWMNLGRPAIPGCARVVQQTPRPSATPWATKAPTVKPYPTNIPVGGTALPPARNPVETTDPRMNIPY